MDENRIQDYLNLIQQLLNCPSGEEPEILQANSDLLDLGFLQVCEGVAAQFAEEGNENAANFLRNLASQLGKFLGKNEDVDDDKSEDENFQTYRDFILELLQAERYSNSDVAIIYPMLAQRQNSLNAGFCESLQQVAENLITEHPEAIESILCDLENLSIDIMKFPLGKKANNIEIAITGFQIVLMNSEPGSENWGGTQNNLGEAYRLRIRGERADNLEKAIASYTTALQVLTHEAFPKYWAMTQNNLAIAYSDRIRGERADNLEKAIASYIAALQVFTHESFPEKWATTQNNLGGAYRLRIRGERADNLEKAIASYTTALQVLTHEAFPKYWAMTQNNLGAAYSDRIRGERADNLDKAIAFFTAALTVYTREAFPEYWATTQNNLGGAYCLRIRGERADNLEKAIASYIAALTVYTREAFPQDWAMTQHNLGAAYSNRIRGEKADNLEKAIAFYTAALKVRTHEAFPQDWAMTQNNLAIAYSDRIRGERADNLEKAIAFYTATLQVYTREAFPQDWAMTQNSLAIAYCLRIRGERADNLEKAIKSFTAALKVRTRQASPRNHAETLFNLGLAYRKVPNLQLAHHTFADAINTVEFLRGEIYSGDEAKQKLAEEWNSLYRNMVEVCLELKNYTEAIEYAERSKARNLVELLATRDIKPKGNISETVFNELSRLRQEIYTEQRRLEIEERNRNISTAMMPETRFLENRTHLNQLQQQLNELITRHIKPIDPNFSLTQQVEPIPYSEIQSLTGENTAILEWYITGDKFLTFIITPQSPTPIIWQSSTADWEKLIKWAGGYLQAYGKKKKDHWKRRLTVRLRLLAKILHLDEILENIPKQCDQLILIPHRYLHLFPLHALPVSQETWLQFNPNSNSSPANSYLLDCFVGGVGYAPSCQLLQQAQMRQRPNFSHLFAIANPTSDRYLLELQAANIRQQFQSNDFLAKDDANKDAILNGKLSLANCAHFGCHGKFEPDSPLESALKLANKQDLTLLEILNLDLNQCRLVTLSACETGLTESSTSDEYIGLPFGFLLAGSPSMVSTLWEVDQLASTLLLIRFYENLETLSTVTALNEAQQWLRNLTSEELEAELERLKPQIDQTFEQLPLKERTRYVNAPLNGARNRKPFPFTEPHYWAGFTAIGV